MKNNNNSKKKKLVIKKKIVSMFKNSYEGDTTDTTLSQTISSHSISISIF